MKPQLSHSTSVKVSVSANGFRLFLATWGELVAKVLSSFDLDRRGIDLIDRVRSKRKGPVSKSMLQLLFSIEGRFMVENYNFNKLICSQSSLYS